MYNSRADTHPWVATLRLLTWQLLSLRLSYDSPIPLVLNPVSSSESSTPLPPAMENETSVLRKRGCVGLELPGLYDPGPKGHWMLPRCSGSRSSRTLPLVRDPWLSLVVQEFSSGVDPHISICSYGEVWSGGGYSSPLEFSSSRCLRLETSSSPSSLLPAAAS